MESKEIKTTFFLSEFEEEEHWLEVQYDQGWKLAEITGRRQTHYIFEKCPEERWVYQLDFRGKDVKREEYLQLFSDYGWEFVLQHDHWFYFRKRRVAAEADLSIFSDRESKINLCRRILSGRLSAHATLFTLSCVIAAAAIFTAFFRSPNTVLFPANPWINDFLKAALPWIGIGLMLASSFSFREYRKLRKRIDTLKNPLP